MLAAWMHDLNPYALRISGGFGIMWYGLSYAAGFALAFVAIRFLAKRGATLIPADRAMDAVIYGAMGAVIGGRLGYAAFYRPSLFVTFTDSVPFWSLLALNEGGMASHGGMIGVAVAAVLISRGFKTDSGERLGRSPVMHVFDVMALAAPLGLMLGRLANFVNGELLGRIVAQPGADAPWWAVRYPQELRAGEGHGVVYTPEQSLALEKLVSEYTLPDQPFQQGVESLIAAIQAGSADAAAQLGPLLSARHPSQIYQALAEGVVLGVVLWIIARKPHRPGVIGAWFLIVYGLLRVLTETVRLPDGHLAVQRVLGLSRGQMLSTVMVVCGAATLVWRARRPADRLGGWATKRE